MHYVHLPFNIQTGKVVYWKGKLRGWDIEQLLRRIEQSRERVLGRISGQAKVGRLRP
jgi:hypothetical protein